MVLNSSPRWDHLKGFATRMTERTTYFDGEYLPESKVCVSFRDRGFSLGDAVFDAERTFGGEIFRLKAHIDRLYRSLEKASIDRG